MKMKIKQEKEERKKLSNQPNGSKIAKKKKGKRKRKEKQTNFMQCVLNVTLSFVRAMRVITFSNQTSDKHIKMQTYVQCDKWNERVVLQKQKQIIVNRTNIHTQDKMNA